MSVKNGYVKLNANADEKKLQEAGIYYNADVNSAYINFGFDETIDLSDSDTGYCILTLNDHILELDLNMIDNANQAFIILPPEYIAKEGHLYGEVYLRYPQNTMMVGRFTSDIKDTLADITSEEIANAYVPKYEEIQNKFNEFKSQFESLGLGTFEDAVKKINSVLAVYNQIYPALKGYAEQEKSTLNSADANNLPVGSYECTDLQNAPKSMTNHTVEAVTLGGSENRRQTVLIDSDTGEMFYKIFSSRTAGGSGAVVDWMRLQGERVLWRNDSGNNFSAPVQLDTSILYFNTIRIRAKAAGNEHIFFAHVPSDIPSASGVSVPINISNCYDDTEEGEIGFENIESTLTFDKNGLQAQLVNPRRVSIKGANYFFADKKNNILITEIAGVM